jgi:molybdate transport system substrate-binding protein
MRHGPPARAFALVVTSVGLVLTSLVGCGSSGGTSSAAGGSSKGGVKGTITVLAASSLTGAFTTLGKQFEAANPGTKVVFSFAASSALATQITQGAPADVFASASQTNMGQVSAAGGADTPTVFVRNVMEIAVPPDNPAHVTGVPDLAKSTVKVALCQAQVPCGTTAAAVFTKAHVTVTPVTEEADVKSVLTKVETGEADAGVVYVTDVLAAGDKVKGIPIGTEINASTSYPIAALTKAPNAAGAKAFVAYVLSAQGGAVLTQDGFLAP